MPTDNHVHSHWSWDTATASSMQLACARAVEIGLPGVAFTEHVDFTDWSRADAINSPTGRRRSTGRAGRCPPEGCAARRRALLGRTARCREAFPELRVLSGIEAGEPHRLFPASVAVVLATGSSSGCRSLHAIGHDGTLTSVDRALFAELDAHDLMRRYFAELVVLVGGSSVFNVLAHCDYPRRYWPTARVGAYVESDFEEEYREVFRALASSGRALEINTRSPLASNTLLRWWWQQGGGCGVLRQRCAPALSRWPHTSTWPWMWWRRPDFGPGAIASTSGGAEG